MVNISLFAGLHTCQVVSRISEPSTVLMKKDIFHFSLFSFEASVVSVGLGVLVNHWRHLFFLGNAAVLKKSFRSCQPVWAFFWGLGN